MSGSYDRPPRGRPLHPSAAGQEPISPPTGRPPTISPLRLGEALAQARAQTTGDYPSPGGPAGGSAGYGRGGGASGRYGTPDHGGDATAALSEPAAPAYDSRLQSPTELQAPAQPGKEYKITASTPIVRARTVTGRSLTLVITIMCFLACLTAGAVYMINQSAAAWLKDVASEVTVQIEQRDKVDNEKLVRDVAGFLGRQPGIRGVRALTVAESAGLLEPWLGQTEGLKALPVPRLIALDLDRTSPPDFAALRVRLGQQYPGVSLDDHRHWQQQIRTVTRSLALGGLAILMLVGAATTAIIVSATRSAMSANREIVEVLHFVGATDRFIAREFEKHFLSLGIKAGLVGAVSAMAVFVLMPALMELLGGGAVTMAELRRLVGAETLDLAGFFLLGIVVVVIAALCMLTSRYGVYRILHSQH